MSSFANFHILNRLSYHIFTPKLTRLKSISSRKHNIFNVLYLMHFLLTLTKPGKKCVAYAMPTFFKSNSCLFVPYAIQSCSLHTIISFSQPRYAIAPIQFQRTLNRVKLSCPACQAFRHGPPSPAGCKLRCRSPVDFRHRMICLVS